jgi:hypothetical protein
MKHAYLCIGTSIYVLGLLTACGHAANSVITMDIPSGTPGPAVAFTQEAYPPLPTRAPTPMSYPPPAEQTRNAIVALTYLAQPTISTTATSCPASTTPENYVDCEYSLDSLGSLKSNRGWLMADWQTAATVYGLSVVSYDGTKMLWLEEFTTFGKTRVVVRAVLILPQIAETETFAQDMCRINNGAADSEIFVAAEIDPNADYRVPNTHIKKAWRANRQTFAFEPLPTEGISCTIDPQAYWR